MLLFDNVVNFILRFLILLLFIAIYTYLLKLEESGCACSLYESQSFLKNFSIFSFIYLTITMFMSPQELFKSLGAVGASIYVVFDIIYIILSITFFWQAISYTRYLINEKCKCSEDMRRELIMWGSIIEIVLIVMLLLINMLIPVIGNCTISIVNSINPTRMSMHNILSDPVKEIKKTPSRVKELFSKTKDTTNKILKSVKNVNKSKGYKGKK
jgi:hypothetical protein